MELNYNKYLSILSEELNMSPDELEEMDDFGAIGVDSLSLFSILTDVEERFQIELNVDDLTEISTVKKMYEVICTKSTVKDAKNRDRELQ